PTTAVASKPRTSEATTNRLSFDIFESPQSQHGGWAPPHGGLRHTPARVTSLKRGTLESAEVASGQDWRGRNAPSRRVAANQPAEEPEAVSGGSLRRSSSSPSSIRRLDKTRSSSSSLETPSWA